VSRRLGLAALAAALVLAVAVYAPTLRSPFQFDDISFVRDNLGLRSLWPPERWIRSFHQETRPLVNLSFALNHAWSGGDPWSYHLVNLGLHLASLILLFLFLRRALVTLGPPWRDRASAVAGAAALLLSVHPLHSESVIYLQGRPGLLATLFGLAALALAARGLGRWPVGGRSGAPVAVAAALAMASKESAAVLPALVLLYDAALVARWRRPELRSRLLSFHAPVWAALIVPVVLFATLRNPHQGVFGAGVVDPLRFYLTQPLVLLFYLRLFVWPAGLSVDHAFPLASPGEPAAWVALAVVIALIAITVRALRRAPFVGFCGAWWFAAVAPTSLVPGREFVAERYLTFATPALCALTAWGAAWAWTRRSPAARSESAGVAALAVAALLAIPFAIRTMALGRSWMSGRALWRQAVALEPQKSRPWYQYAWFLWHDADYAEAERAVRRGLQVEPRDLRSRLLLARIQADQGQLDSALASARAVEALAPRNPETLVTLAQALMQVGRWNDALAACERALAADSTAALAWYYRAQCRTQLGDTTGARADAARLEAWRPDAAFGPHVVGMLDLRAGRDSSAERWLALALAREPGQLEARRDHALALLKLGRAQDSLEEWRRYFAATRSESWDFEALYYVALCHQKLRHDREAAEALRAVTRLRPTLAEAWIELAYTLAWSPDPGVRDPAAARAALEEGLRHTDPQRADMRARAAEVRRGLESAP
jgi:tetratricopeptide (TPR) repeat protein